MYATINISHNFPYHRNTISNLNAVTIFAVADDCTGKSAYSWHLYRDDPDCATYYQCGAEGDGILLSDRGCDVGEVFDVQAEICSTESSCYER